MYYGFCSSLLEVRSEKEASLRPTQLSVNYTEKENIQFNKEVSTRKKERKKERNKERKKERERKKVEKGREKAKEKENKKEKKKMDVEESQ